MNANGGPVIEAAVATPSVTRTAGTIEPVHFA
jgi:hypothetical protein